jgi:hypothetical protein
VDNATAWQAARSSVLARLGPLRFHRGSFAAVWTAVGLHPPGAAGSAVDQDCAKTLPREAVRSTGGD